MQEENKEVPIFLIMTYHPDYTGLQTQVKKKWDLFEKFNLTRPLYDLKLKIGQIRQKKLIDLIAHKRPRKESQKKKKERSLTQNTAGTVRRSIKQR